MIAVGKAIWAVWAGVFGGNSNAQAVVNQLLSDRLRGPEAPLFDFFDGSQVADNERVKMGFQKPGWIDSKWF
ncbi:hypothetical protein [Alcanivorax jadensis]|uniref:hypothetical protein n=1 Tax=Alcanivorax jadensis TaxID=64988 RepID=UPI00300144BD|tara:strand:- start:554 stop:769 length:216 start_codon:yes stop_codon:yes gene_type:complete